MGIFNIFKSNKQSEEKIVEVVKKEKKTKVQQTQVKPVRYEKKKDKQVKQWVTTENKVDTQDEDFSFEIKQGLEFAKHNIETNAPKTQIPTGFEQRALVAGQIIAENGDDFLVDIEYQSDAILPKSEAGDATIGDTVTAVIFRKNYDDIYISVRQAMKQENILTFVKLMEEEKQVAGKVIGFDKFFFNVELATGLIAKCHVRNIDAAFVSDSTPFIGNTYKFVIKSYNEKKGFELSRKELIDNELQVVFDAIEVGSVVEATIARVMDKITILTYNGLDIIVPIKEVNYSFITKCEDGLQELGLEIGDTIKVKVIEKRVDKINRNTTKNVIVASIRETLEDPFATFTSTHEVESELSAVVAKVEKTFCLVTLANNVNGLLHFSNLTSQRDLKVGESIDVAIIEIDLEKQKIKLKEVNKSA